MNDETLMLINQLLDYTKNLNQRFTNINADIDHLDERFKRNQDRTMHSETMMDLAYSDLHKLKFRIDNLEDDLTAAKKQ